MEGTVKLIKFTIVVSIISLMACIVSYLIPINFINDFIFTISIGIFTSVLVVLMSEIQKYITGKKSVEGYIFYQTVYLYMELFLMEQNIIEYQKNTRVSIPANLLDQRSENIRCQVNVLKSVDYTPFIKKNMFKKMHQRFCMKIGPDIIKVTVGNLMLNNAILDAKIVNLQNGFNENKMITSIDEPVKTVLFNQLNKVSNALGKVDEYLNYIDGYSNYRYSWEREKKNIHSNYVGTLEKDYYKEGYLRGL